MKHDILVLNAGSSSIKFTLYGCPTEDSDPLHTDAAGQIERIGSTRARFHARGSTKRETLLEQTLENRERVTHEQALEALLDWLRSRPEGGRLLAAGHRIVHGGAKHFQPRRIDDALLSELQRLVPLAPLHQPHNLEAVRALSRLDPALPQVACFDTAFHRTQPELAERFALPQEYWERGLRRYGFHGLSYEYIAGVLPRYLDEPSRRRVIVAHLGNGASLCAMRDRKSVATSMGLTALEGLPMGTRCGTLDPGVVLYLIEQEGLSAKAVTDLLYDHSGLLGVSGISADVRELLASEAPRAALALDLFVYHIIRQIGALTATLGGLDALVFTAGIGEHADAIRDRVCRQLRWLSLELDPDANRCSEHLISAPHSKVKVLVIPTDEDRIIAEHCRRLIAAPDHQDRP